MSNPDDFPIEVAVSAIFSDRDCISWLQNRFVRYKSSGVQIGVAAATQYDAKGYHSWPSPYVWCLPHRKAKQEQLKFRFKESDAEIATLFQFAFGG